MEPQKQERPDEIISDIEWRDAGRIIGSGACMGTADLVPGVSGGTMAVALGIYQELLAAITSINVRFLVALLRRDFRGAIAIVHWRFIACLGLGLVAALVVMGKIVKLPQMTIDNPKPVYAVFFGLVLASAVVLVRGIKSWDATKVIALPIGALVGYVIVTLVPVDTPEGAHYMFLYGVIAIIAMILPGISGSFILLVLRKYEYVISSLLELNLAVIVPFALGCAVGLSLFSRVLGWLLHRWEGVMLSGLTGLLFGSLVRIWPYQNVVKKVVHGKERVLSADAFMPETLEASVIVLAVLGFISVLALEFVATRRRRQVAA